MGGARFGGLCSIIGSYQKFLIIPLISDRCYNFTMTLENFPLYRSPTSLGNEKDYAESLLRECQWTSEESARAQHKARQWIDEIRQSRLGLGDIENFLQHYPLASPEGRALMTLAEALLRIPDTETQDKLIAEKISVSDWSKMGGGLFGSASSMGLGLAKNILGGFLSGVSKPVIRKATIETVRRLGSQFVLGETIEDAMEQGEKLGASATRISFDMLGEGARTLDDAERYYQSYIHAIHTIGQQNNGQTNLLLRHGLSVKLSALHPRYHWTHQDICVPVIVERLLNLAHLAVQYNITLTMDAEESERLELHLACFTGVVKRLDFQNWAGLGLAVQAYDKRALSVIDYIADLAKSSQNIFQIRLVKGAYWDGEIKRAQMAGWPDYPVYTHKALTDLSYLVCAQKLMRLRPRITPLLATHNAVTAASVLEFSHDDKSGFEIQQLYGMGNSLRSLLRKSNNIPVTLYAPVGSYQDLLPYLVRRMLENGANSSFVSQIRSSALEIDRLAEDVVNKVTAQLKSEAGLSEALPLPPNLYHPHRKNSTGYDLSRQSERDKIIGQSAEFILTRNPAQSLANGLDPLFEKAQSAFKTWSQEPSSGRAGKLRLAADIIEQNTGHFLSLLQGEGKKTLFDALAEIREAVDFLRYYAAEGERVFAPQGEVLKSYTGERNSLSFTGRGVFVAISPWNFPLAIFIGQVSAALMAGNAVIAKAAEQTPQVAALAVNCLFEAGISPEALILVEGDGKLGASLVEHSLVAGVVFTGSTEVARSINQTLARKDGPIIPLIAETGGLNAMIVDSTALPEQVVDDVILSAFGSAGQRCSALRVLYLQHDIADKVIALLQGAMSLLVVGSPQNIETDIPPMIDKQALSMLQAHQAHLDNIGKLVARANLPEDIQDDCLFAPCAYEIDSVKALKDEVFGPILHIIRFHDSDGVIDDINSKGYGLTFGLQSRLQEHHQRVISKIRAGNLYINRSMIGAVVGVQPFGGMGLSGTGPKAGGPHYLPRFATEVTISDNIMASGGNIDLLTGLEE
jgi:RHH-type proline utilization regulon transcriptional repressor/proline dehydrogenase/delta 1-pyrroline-5-carboxylate dehydrogenase